MHCSIRPLDGHGPPEARAAMDRRPTRPSAPRAPDRPFVALGRRQIDYRRACCSMPTSDVTMSISATTRPERPGEVDDIDYHFVDDAEFDRMIEDDDFVEWAHVFGYRYGTPKEPVKQALSDGPRHPVRHRLAGNAAARAAFGERSRHDLPPSPVDGGAGAAAARRAAPIQRRVIADRMRRAAARDQSLGRI